MHFVDDDEVSLSHAGVSALPQSNQQKFSKIVVCTEIPIYKVENLDLSHFVCKENLHYHKQKLNSDLHQEIPIEKPNIGKLENKPDPRNLFPVGKSDVKIEKVEKLIIVLMKNTSFNEFETVCQINQESNSKYSNLTSLKCKTCKNLEFQVELECKHHTCISCLQTNIKNLITNPDVEALKKVRCSSCLMLHTVNDLKKVCNDSNTIDQFQALSIERSCGFCKRNLNACTEFFTELSCMHLCSVCYMNELFMGSKSCMVCEIPYKKKSVTFSRTGNCSACGNSDKLVQKLFRYLHRDHLHCYDCLTKVTKSKTCLVCSLELSKIEEALMVNYFQKMCPQCLKYKGIIDIKVCRNCESIICDSCYNEPYCPKCLVYYIS